jgi:hypothetical protein
MKRTRSELASIGFFAPLVMGARMSRMMLPDALRTASDRAEDTRMVAEKLQAAGEAVVAAQLEASRQMTDAWIGMAFGRAPKPARAMDAIASAALKPVRRKVRANVKRLGK